VRTPELLDVLAADTRIVPRDAASRWLALAAGAGMLAALALVLVWLRLRPDLARAAAGGFFWIKALYTAALGLAGYWAAERLGRPGVSARTAGLTAIAVLAVFALLAVVQFAPMNSAARLAALQGVSWTVCSRNIVLLAAPMTLFCLLVLRGLAPTRPIAAGFAAGVFSGGICATVYGLHCPEATFVFVGLWYTLGVLTSGLIGGVVGRFTLKW
jgi:hypothetical protein